MDIVDHVEEQAAKADAKPEKKPRKKRESNSRPARWGRAVAEMQEALARIDAAKGDWSAAAEELSGLKEEYEEWLGNTPESLQQSTLGEKLQAIVDLDIDTETTDINAMQTLTDEAEGMDLPRGFGQD